MRIISGSLKGKRINFIKSATTRPLRDFVKENIFNIINHSSLIDVKLKDANVLDLYSGVGSFGIECISQGAKKTTFVENDNKAVTILRQNLNDLKIENQSEILNEKSISFFKRLKNTQKFEIIFFDPPFVENLFVEEVQLVKNSRMYKKKHLIIIHRENKTEDNLEKFINIILVRNYGRSKIIFGVF